MYYRTSDLLRLQPQLILNSPTSVTAVSDTNRKRAFTQPFTMIDLRVLYKPYELTSSNFYG